VQQTTWEPPAAGIAGCGAIGVLMAIASVTLVTDTPGALLTGIAALGLILLRRFVARASEAGNYPRGPGAAGLVPDATIATTRHQDHPDRRVPPLWPQGSVTRGGNGQRGAGDLLPLGPGYRSIGRARRPHRRGYAGRKGAEQRWARAAGCLGDRDGLDDDRFGGPVVTVGGRRRDRIDDLL